MMNPLSKQTLYVQQALCLAYAKQDITEMEKDDMLAVSIATEVSE